MNLAEQLIRDEGLRLKPYKDTVGKLTIGVGRNLDDKGISHREAMDLLYHDIGDCEADIDRCLPWAKDMANARYSVLVNMCFNLGIHGLLQFKKTLAAMEMDNYRVAALEMLDSKWAGQVGDRASRLARQMETSQWE